MLKKSFHQNNLNKLKKTCRNKNLKRKKQTRDKKMIIGKEINLYNNSQTFLATF